MVVLNASGYSVNRAEPKITRYSLFYFRLIGFRFCFSFSYLPRVFRFRFLKGGRVRGNRAGGHARNPLHGEDDRLLEGVVLDFYGRVVGSKSTAELGMDK